MDKLNDVVPYGVATGNHDLNGRQEGATPAASSWTTTARSGSKSIPWYGGASASGFSSYQIFSGGGYKFLALELTVNAPKAEIEWAKKIIAEHPDLPVILTTHQMLNHEGPVW